MEIVGDKRKSIFILALVFGTILFFIGIMELLLIWLESWLQSISFWHYINFQSNHGIFINFIENPIFFSSTGGAVFENSLLDHILKAFVSFVISGMFLYGVPKIKKGSIDGFSFLIGGGILILCIGLLFFAIWAANLLDAAIISKTADPEVWNEYVITDGIRIEWFLAIGTIKLLSIWKKRKQYLK